VAWSDAKPKIAVALQVVVHDCVIPQSSLQPVVLWKSHQLHLASGRESLPWQRDFMRTTDHGLALEEPRSKGSLAG
jgi:hypothetical protein